jgi:hypothetical protein
VLHKPLDFTFVVVEDVPALEFRKRRGSSP